ncbi:MAG: hypothetical protein JOZ41_22070 [Chloroflexi bacterium]|nr:hypothetical protein [Chloroflexota bacterium]
MVVGVTALTSLGLGASIWARPARAELAPCRSDPVVILSNGVTLDLSAYINDGESDVSNVAYVLHAPGGTTISSVIGTDGAIGLKETFSFSADAPSNTYTVETRVTTGLHGIAVIATTDVVSAAATESVSVAGQDNQNLRVSITT